jgi:hypothetical protein
MSRCTDETPQCTHTRRGIVPSAPTHDKQGYAVYGALEWTPVPHMTPL